VLIDVGVITPEKINILKKYLFLELGVIFDYSQPIRQLKDRKTTYYLI
jgi:hypothetical protein